MRIRIGKRVVHIKPLHVAVLVGVVASLVVFWYANTFFRESPYYMNYVLLSVFLLFIPVGAYVYLNYRNVLAMEYYFPKFLRDLADASRAGMALPQAVVYVSKINYGPLSQEVKKLANQLSWGVAFEEALRKFAQRTGSRFIRSSVELIIEAYTTGGNVADILETVAEDARKIHDMREERKTRFSGFIMTLYTVFIVYLIIVIVLVNNLLPEVPTIPRIAGASIFGISPSGGGVSVPEEELRTLLFHLSIIEAVFSGLLAGVIGEGNITAGVKHAVLLSLIALAVFQLFVPLPDPADRIARAIAKSPVTLDVTVNVGKFYVERNVTVDDVRRKVNEYLKSISGGVAIERESVEMKFVESACEPCAQGLVAVKPDGVYVNEPTYLIFTVRTAKEVYEIYVS